MLRGEVGVAWSPTTNQGVADGDGKKSAKRLVRRCLFFFRDSWGVTNRMGWLVGCRLAFAVLGLRHDGSPGGPSRFTLFFGI